MSRYDNLQANLVFLVDEGRKAFIDAETRMDKLVMHSKYLFAEDGVVRTACNTNINFDQHTDAGAGSKANRIVDALNDETTATKILPGCMDDLREAIEECEKIGRAHV